MTSKNEGINEARDRLRQKAQNEATCFALSDLLRLKEKEVESLRDQVNGLTGSLDRAERALKEAQEQPAVAFWWADGTGGIHGGPYRGVPDQLAIDLARSKGCTLRLLYARPAPAAPAVAGPAVPEEWRCFADLLRRKFAIGNDVLVDSVRINRDEARALLQSTGEKK